MAGETLSPEISLDNDSDRFWSFVEKHGHPNGCWIWTRSVSDGYGNFYNIDERRAYRAHRYSWLLSHGSLPRWEAHAPVGILHRCDNRRCVNPAHLFIGTQKENLHDMMAKGRHRPAGKKVRLSPFTKVEG